MTAEGVIVAYRNRSEDEIRDIYTTRWVEDGWTQPEPVANDLWQIPGCPVNGPSIIADGQNVAIAWFTAANEVEQVQVAFSADAGATFGAPIRIDEGSPSGRVALVWADSTSAWVSWMEKTDSGNDIRLLKVGPEGKQGESRLLLEADGSRRSGFPILAKAKNELYLAWTAVDSLDTQARTARIIINN